MAAVRPRVAIISSRIRLEERLLLEALDRRRLAAVHVDDRLLVFRLGAPVDLASVALNRSISATRRRHVGRILDSGGVPTVNPYAVVMTCDDKVATSLALLRDGIAVPDTVLALSPEGGIGAIHELDFPVVVKPVTGSWGRLVGRINDVDAAEAILELRAVLGGPEQKAIYVQRYIDKPGRDIRAVVVDDRVVAAINRCSAHWVTSAARSAIATPCEVDDELEKACLAAARAVGGGAVAVDLLESNDGELFVNEVNATMEFRAVAEATGVDIAGAIADHVVAVERANR